jgi:hypothetical protein
MSGRYIYDEQGNPREEADLMKWAKKAGRRMMVQDAQG